MRHESIRRAHAVVLLALGALGAACSDGEPRAPLDSAQQQRGVRRPDSILGSPPSQILLLGTFDLENAILSDPTSQLEMTRIVDELVKFQPTVIAVGVPREEQDKLDQHYDDYVNGRAKPARTAIDQIALRVARERGLRRVWAIDSAARADPTVIDLADYAARNGQAELLRSDLVDRYERWFERERKTQVTESIQDNLVWLNNPRRLAEAHGRLLVGEFDLGDEHNFIGPDALISWYNRHLRIFSNVQRLAGPNGERILVVIDVRHIPLLRDLARASPRFELLDVDAFLGVPQGVQRQMVPLL